MFPILILLFTLATFVYVFFLLAALYHLREYILPGDKKPYMIFSVFAVISLVLWIAAVFSLLAIP